MSMLELLANQAQLKKFLGYVALTPLVLPFIQIAEGAGGTGPEKRATVIAAVMGMLQESVKRGYVPSTALDELEKTAGELTDVAVKLFNTQKFFETESPAKTATAKKGGKDK